MIRNLFYPDRNWNLKSRNLAEKKFDYKCLLSRNIHEENCLKSENIGDIASSYDFSAQVDSSAVFDAQYESHGSEMGINKTICLDIRYLRIYEY